MVRAFAHDAIGHRINPSSYHGEPIELFLVCLWDDAYKRTLAAKRKE